MSRSPCVTAAASAGFKNLLTLPPVNRDLFNSNNNHKSPAQRSPNLLLPPPAAHQPYNNFRASLSPYQRLSPRNFGSPNCTNLFPGQSSPSVDSPQRLLFASKIKSAVTSSNLLGRGRFGQVVLAKYKDDYVAVKIIKEAQKNINEVNGQRLSHPNIISILKIERVDDDVLVLMEPWGSLNLQQLLSLSVKIPWSDVLSYSRQLAKALEYCHSSGVLHLDVKPANIMVNNQQWIKLGDFGNSLAVGSFQQQLQQPRVGTVTYCAPEILQGDDPTTKSDVYSYGITLWQLDHNQMPFSGLSWPTVAYLVVAKNERPALRSDLAGEEERLSRLYQACWSPDPSQRPAMSNVLSTLSTFE